MNPNVLRQWMDFYDQQGMGGGRIADAGDGRMVPVRDDNRMGRRMMFAQQMASAGQPQGGGENFFAEQEQQMAPQAFVRPQMREASMPQQMPQRQRPSMDNYFAMLRGR
jgi:hypothetical protein